MECYLEDILAVLEDKAAFSTVILPYYLRITKIISLIRELAIESQQLLVNQWISESS